MADLNTTYHPYIQSFDYDAIKAEIAYDLWPDDSEIKQNMNKFLTELKQADAQQLTTANAVAIPYTGTTTADRQAWLKARIDAIYDRLDLIRGFVEGYKAQAAAAGAELPADPMKTIGSVLTLIPLTAPVGAAASLIARLMNTDSGNAQYKAQKLQEASTAVTGFAQDVTQLQTIRAQLVNELAALPTNNTDATSNAPNIRTDYLLYIVLAAVLLGLIVWVRLRKRKRSKR